MHAWTHQNFGCCRVCKSFQESRIFPVHDQSWLVKPRAGKWLQIAANDRFYPSSKLFLFLQAWKFVQLLRVLCTCFWICAFFYTQRYSPSPAGCHSHLLSSLDVWLIMMLICVRCSDDHFRIRAAVFIYSFILKAYHWLLVN